MIQDKEAERLLSSDLVVKEALRAAAEDGIVFIDEIDKIVDSQRGSVSTSANVSNEGVQRDLLPILEGCQVRQHHGVGGWVSTSHNTPNTCSHPDWASSRIAVHCSIRGGSHHRTAWFMSSNPDMVSPCRPFPSSTPCGHLVGTNTSHLPPCPSLPPCLVCVSPR